MYIYTEAQGKFANTVVIIALFKIYLDICSRWVLSLPPQYPKGVVNASEADKKEERAKGC